MQQQIKLVKQQRLKKIAVTMRVGRRGVAMAWRRSN
jgi:hypothetical protein